MLLLVPVIIALLAALWRGGSPRNLATLPIRGSGYLVAALAIQIMLYLPPLRGSQAVSRWGGVIYVGALGLALIGAWHNRRLGLAIRLATLGVVLNTTVIAANGGYMPADAAATRAVGGAAPAARHTNAAPVEYDNTREATPATRLILLSDILPVPVPGGFGNVCSAGDVLLALGVATLVYRATRRPYREDA